MSGGREGKEWREGESERDERKERKRGDLVIFRDKTNNFLWVFTAQQHIVIQPIFN